VDLGICTPSTSQRSAPTPTWGGTSTPAWWYTCRRCFTVRSCGRPPCSNGCRGLCCLLVGLHHQLCIFITLTDFHWRSGLHMVTMSTLPNLRNGRRVSSNNTLSIMPRKVTIQQHMLPPLRPNRQMQRRRHRHLNGWFFRSARCSFYVGRDYCTFGCILRLLRFLKILGTSIPRGAFDLSPLLFYCM
jgi:hypothetical protein